MSYRNLDPALILETARRLEKRVCERFPEAGLCGVAGELVRLAQDVSTHAESLRAPMWWLRLSLAAVVLGGAAMFLYFGSFLTFERIDRVGFDLVQGVEAVVNTAVLAGIGLIALSRLEARTKQRAVFGGLHGLRSLIHIIDMHQLTKDPSAMGAGIVPTQSSPQRRLSSAELVRYLDYCSEMLSLSGKLAALYAQAVNDEVVADAVNDIENLGTNLSRKIWQKIMLIEPA